MFAWDDLKYFLAFAREGSMQGAAKALGVNQSTVQRRISELEERLEFFEETDMAVVVSSAQNEIEEFKHKGLDIAIHRKRMVKEDLEIKRKVLANVAAAVASDESAGEHPLLAHRPEKRILLVLITGDKGLAGAFNSTLIKSAQRFSGEHGGAAIRMELIGRKGRDFYLRGT